jgi:DNA-binding response OmpR family regulator
MASAALRSKKGSPVVMVIEDDGVTQELLAAAFEEAGMRVELADTCAAAMRLVRTVQPDIFVVDRQVPDGDAWLAVANLKRAARVEDAPVIALTGHPALRNVERAFIAGCDAFLEKPVAPDVVVGLAQRLLALRPPPTSIRKRKLDDDDE